MAFDKDYPNRKDRRRPYYRKASRWDPSCRPNGGCPWCAANRTWNDRRRRLLADQAIQDFQGREGQ